MTSTDFLKFFCNLDLKKGNAKLKKNTIKKQKDNKKSIH